MAVAWFLSCAWLLYFFWVVFLFPAMAIRNSVNRRRIPVLRASSTRIGILVFMFGLSSLSKRLLPQLRWILAGVHVSNFFVCFLILFLLIVSFHILLLAVDSRSGWGIRQVAATGHLRRCPCCQAEHSLLVQSFLQL